MASNAIRVHININYARRSWRIGRHCAYFKRVQKKARLRHVNRDVPEKFKTRERFAPGRTCIAYETSALRSYSQNVL